jgi:hypothetical protein
MDRLLDEARNGAAYLRQPAIANMMTKSLKGITARRANAMLALTGSPFWQEESYDRLVRHMPEFEKIRNYIEENPVRSGLAGEARDYRWSSAGWATRGSAADQGVRPSVPDMGRILLDERSQPEPMMVTVAKRKA